MKLADEHIDRIMKLHKEKFKRPFASREEATEYLLILCKIFDWLLKHNPDSKPPEETDDK